MLKFCLSRRSGVAVAALLGVSLLSASARAQDNGQPLVPVLPSPPVSPDFFENLKPVTIESMVPSPAPYGVEFPVRNVKASLIAYWLDSAHQPTPPDIRNSQMSEDAVPSVFSVMNAGAGAPSKISSLPRLPGNGKGPEGVKLPEGVSRIIALDPQNKILAFGTKEGLRAFNALLPSLDVPLVQYEIEAQFLSVARADLRALGVDFGEAREQPFYSFGAVSALGRVPGERDVQGLSVGYIQGPIAKLIGEGRAKVLTAPRVTAIDGLTAQLQQTTATPFRLSTPTGVKLDGETRMEQNLAYLTTAIGIRATAVRVKDDQMWLSITPTLGTRTLSVSTAVRDGQSFAIQMSPATDDNQIVIIVTIRRIQRANKPA